MLGEVPKINEARDAVHVAVAPAVALMPLQPGDHVGLDLKGRASTELSPHVGVVDPFRTTMIYQGERFWLLMYPNTVQGLRHEWDHPAFAARPNLVAPWNSEQWLAKFGEEHGWDYEDTLRIIKSHVETADAGVDMEVPPEVYDHYEVVTGMHVAKGRRTPFFSNDGCKNC
jgi:hypothetical protein